MRIFRISNIFAWSLAVFLGSVLFYVSQSVQRSEDEYAKLQRLSGLELEAIRVLEAEWDYLNSPTRLEALSEDYLQADGEFLPQITDSVASIPEPVVPVIPRIKPAHFSSSRASSSTVEPAVLSIAAKPSARSVRKAPSQKTVKQIQNHDRDQFKNLLEGLNDGGAY